MKILNTNDDETGSPVLKFLDDYKESERLKACIMSVYGLDLKCLMKSGWMALK